MDFFGWLLGTADGKASYVLTRWVFLRALGVIYLIAFVSLWVQIRGLIGSQGIVPAQQYLHAVEGYVGGVARYRFAPSVLWLGAGDGALHLVCALGALCAVLLICDVAPVPCLALLWALYLSLAAVGQDFLAFQWDVLLLETGLLAILFAPGYEGSIRPAWGRFYAEAGFLLVGVYSEGPDRGVAEGLHGGIGADFSSGALLWNVNSRLLWFQRRDGANVFGVQLGASLSPRIGR